MPLANWTPARPDPRCEILETTVNASILRPGIRRLALHDSTFRSALPDYLAPSHRVKQAIAGLDSTTLRNYARANQSRRPACRALPSGMDVVLISDTSSYTDNWSEFYLHYPGTAGMTSTSGIGISDDGHEALLLLGHDCGSLCGRKSIVILRRSVYGWQIAFSSLLWVS